MAQPSFEKVPGRQFGDQFIVGLDPRQFWQQPSRAHVDDRQSRRQHDVGDLLVFDTGNDAIALPILQPARRRVAAALLRSIDGPRLMLLQKPMNAAQQAACIGIGSFDAQRHTRPIGASGEISLFVHPAQAG